MKINRSVREAFWIAVGNFYLTVLVAAHGDQIAGMVCLFFVPIVALVISVVVWRDGRNSHREAVQNPHPIELEENPIGVSYLYHVVRQGSWPRMGLPVALLRLVQVGYARFVYDKGELAVELESAPAQADDLDIEAHRVFQKLSLGTNRFSISDIATFAKDQRANYAALCKSWVEAVKSSPEFKGFGFSLRRVSRMSCLIVLLPDIILGSLILSMAGEVLGNRDLEFGLLLLVYAICAAASIFWYLGSADPFRMNEQGRSVLVECDAYVKWLESEDAKNELAEADPERLRELQLWAVALGVSEGVEFPVSDVVPDAKTSDGAFAASVIPYYVSHSLFTHEQHSEIDEAFSEANESALGGSDGFSSSADAGGFGGGDGGDGGGCGGCGGGCGGCGGD